MTDQQNQSAPNARRGEQDAPEQDPRSDIEQAVQARADAVARGEGGPPQGIAAPGDYSGVSGDGGEVKNQDINAQ
jgi:hypothetical protein